MRPDFPSPTAPPGDPWFRRWNTFFIAASYLDPDSGHFPAWTVSQSLLILGLLWWWLLNVYLFAACFAGILWAPTIRYTLLRDVPSLFVTIYFALIFLLAAFLARSFGRPLYRAASNGYRWLVLGVIGSTRHARYFNDRLAIRLHRLITVAAILAVPFSIYLVATHILRDIVAMVFVYEVVSIIVLALSAMVFVVQIEEHRNASGCRTAVLRSVSKKLPASGSKITTIRSDRSPF